MGELFEVHPEKVFYGRQIEVMFEKRFFHWITTRALGELGAQRDIESAIEILAGAVSIRFYWSKKNRYWRRQANRIRKLVQQFSLPEFGRALGAHAETMFDAALPTVGFLPKARNVREYAGRVWTKTGHDLDRVFERDGIAYGTEIKNSLDYITRDELELKLEMCRELFLKPLFIVRMAPKNYVETVRRAGGFTLIFEYQLYPHGTAQLAKVVRQELGLRVDSPRAIWDGTMQRFLNWHLKELVGGGSP
jgi:hypothetical protein